MDFKCMTKYERVTIIGQRAQDIANGSPITIQNPPTDDPVSIATLEFEAGRIPYKIVRNSPSGEQMVFKVTEFCNY